MTITCGCWRCGRRAEDATLHMLSSWTDRYALDLDGKPWCPSGFAQRFHAIGECRCALMADPIRPPETDEEPSCCEDPGCSCDDCTCLPQPARDWSRIVSLLCVAGMVAIAFLAGVRWPR